MTVIRWNYGKAGVQSLTGIGTLPGLVVRATLGRDFLIIRGGWTAVLDVHLAAQLEDGVTLVSKHDLRDEAVDWCDGVTSGLAVMPPSCWQSWFRLAARMSDNGQTVSPDLARALAAAEL